MLTRTINITQAQVIWQPEIHITGSSGNRVAIVSCPIISDGHNLDPIYAIFEWEEFNTFYDAYISDKSAVAMLFEKNNIDVDISVITNDFIN